MSLFETYWLVYLTQRRWAGRDDWNFYGTFQPMVAVHRQVPSYSWLHSGHRMGSRRQLATLGLGVSVESRKTLHCAISDVTEGEDTNEGSRAVRFFENAIDPGVLLEAQCVGGC
jgi:hypothetical protein